MSERDKCLLGIAELANRIHDLTEEESMELWMRLSTIRAHTVVICDHVTDLQSAAAPTDAEIERGVAVLKASLDDWDTTVEDVFRMALRAALNAARCPHE